MFRGRGDMLYLSEKQAEELIRHSKRESPNEACGILAGLPAGQAGKVYPELRGRDRKVERVYPMTNADRSSETFFMDPKEQLKVMKEIRNLGLEMVGIYHSHPASEAYPSARDVELAYYPEVSYVIISIRDKDNPGIRSFRIVEGKIEEEEVKIGDR